MSIVSSELLTIITGGQGDIIIELNPNGELRFFYPDDASIAEPGTFRTEDNSAKPDPTKPLVVLEWVEGENAGKSLALFIWKLTHQLEMLRPDYAAHKQAENKETAKMIYRAGYMAALGPTSVNQDVCTELADEAFEQEWLEEATQDEG